MTVILRRLQAADIPQVTVLIGEAFGSNGLGTNVGSHLASYASSSQSQALITEQTTAALPAEYWVTEDESSLQIVGTSGIYRFWWTSHTCLWLGWFCVAPSYQRKGLGSAIAKQTMAIARARGATYFKIETDNDGTAARFYERLGFQQEALLAGHYDDAMDAVVMRRSLLDIQPAQVAEHYELEH